MAVAAASGTPQFDQSKLTEVDGKIIQMKQEHPLTETLVKEDVPYSQLQMSKEQINTARYVANTLAGNPAALLFKFIKLIQAGNTLYGTHPLKQIEAILTDETSRLALKTLYRDYRNNNPIANKYFSELAGAFKDRAINGRLSTISAERELKEFRDHITEFSRSVSCSTYRCNPERLKIIMEKCLQKNDWTKLFSYLTKLETEGKI